METGLDGRESERTVTSRGRDPARPSASPNGRQGPPPAYATRSVTVAAIAGTTILAAALHLALPAGSHPWYWLHLVAGKLYLIAILLAAARLGLRAALATAGAASGLFAIHVVRQWAGLPMVQADQWAALVDFWLVAGVAGALFERVRRDAAELRVAHEETLAALAGSLELREPYTGGHSRRVRGYSLLLAEEMGLTDDEFRTGLARGALLHDIGKIGIPDRILLKEASLTGDEWRLMRRHPDLGASLLGDIPFLQKTRELVRAHHERHDGSGYPRGLAGEGIPLEARIFSVADAFDALTTNRPYRPGASWTEATRQIAEGHGSQFAPEIVDAFLRVPFDEWSRVASDTGMALRKDADERQVEGIQEGGLSDVRTSSEVECQDADREMRHPQGWRRRAQ